MPGGDAGFDIDDVLAEATPVRATAAICVRQDLVARHADLEQNLATARAFDLTRNEEPTAPAIAEQIGELEDEIERFTRVFEFEALGNRAWADLHRDHPPRDGERGNYSPETFPAAAIAASCVAPRMTYDQAKELEAKLNFGQWELLWQAVLAANVDGGVDRPKSLAAIALRRRNGGSAITAPPEASLAASS